MSRFRRPAAPSDLPDRLPARAPGENPHEDVIHVLTQERDGVMVRLDEVSRERNELDAESERLARERDELVLERDDLATRSLPTWADVLAGVYEPEVRPILGQMPGQGCEPLVVQRPEAVRCVEHEEWMPAYALAEHKAQPHRETAAYESWH